MTRVDHNRESPMLLCTEAFPPHRLHECIGLRANGGGDGLLSIRSTPVIDAVDTTSAGAQADLLAVARRASRTKPSPASGPCTVPSCRRHTNSLVHEFGTCHESSLRRAFAEVAPHSPFGDMPVGTSLGAFASALGMVLAELSCPPGCTCSCHAPELVDETEYLSPVPPTARLVVLADTGNIEEARIPYFDAIFTWGLLCSKGWQVIETCTGERTTLRELQLFLLHSRTPHAYPPLQGPAPTALQQAQDLTRLPSFRADDEAAASWGRIWHDQQYDTVCDCKRTFGHVARVRDKAIVLCDVCRRPVHEACYPETNVSALCVCSRCRRRPNPLPASMLLMEDADGWRRHWVPFAFEQVDGRHGCINAWAAIYVHDAEGVCAALLVLETRNLDDGCTRTFALPFPTLSASFVHAETTLVVERLLPHCARLANFMPPPERARLLEGCVTFERVVRSLVEIEQLLATTVPLTRARHLTDEQRDVLRQTFQMLEHAIHSPAFHIRQDPLASSTSG